MSRFRTPLVRCAGLLALLFMLGLPTRSEEKVQPSRPVLSYTIALTDRLRITVYQEEDLSVIARVDTKGTGNLPLVGEIQIYGKTVSEAQKIIEASYRSGRYLKNPQVTINIEEYAPREVS